MEQLIYEVRSTGHTNTRFQRDSENPQIENDVMVSGKRGQGVLFEIAKCPACHRNIKVSLVDGEIYSHQESEWSTEVCEQTGNRIQQFALGIKIGQPQQIAPEEGIPSPSNPAHDETVYSVKPIYIGKHRQ